MHLSWQDWPYKLKIDSMLKDMLSQKSGSYNDRYVGAISDSGLCVLFQEKDSLLHPSEWLGQGYTLGPPLLQKIYRIHEMQRLKSYLHWRAIRLPCSQKCHFLVLSKKWPWSLCLCSTQQFRWCWAMKLPLLVCSYACLDAFRLSSALYLGLFRHGVAALRSLCTRSPRFHLLHRRMWSATKLCDERDT